MYATSSPTTGTSFRTFSKILFLLVVLGTFFGSCKKKDDMNQLELGGRVLDITTGAGVAGAEVELGQQTVESGTFSSVYDQVETVSTNSSGRFYFEFPRENASDYRILVDRDGYFGEEVHVNPNDVQPGDPANVTIQMTPRAWVKVQMINANPFDAADLATFRFLNASFDCACCTNDETTYTGTDVNENFSCQIEGNYLMRYRYSITRDGVNEAFTDSIWCASFDTTLIQINY